jgi:uncharacterized cupredoxin-like copper-binding protein
VTISPNIPRQESHSHDACGKVLNTKKRETIMKKIPPLFLLISLMLVLSACGDSNAASSDIQVTMTDFHFTPDRFTIPAGGEITLTTTNNGAVEHEFVIFKLGTNPGDKFSPEDEANIYWQTRVLPGESKAVTFTAPAEPGEYYLVCGISGHLEAGMSGRIIVVTK